MMLKNRAIFFVVGVIFVGACMGTGFTRANAARAATASTEQPNHLRHTALHRQAAGVHSARGSHRGSSLVVGGRTTFGANGELELLGGGGKVAHAISFGGYGGSHGNVLRSSIGKSLTQNAPIWIEQEETPQAGAQFFGTGLAMDGNTAFISFDAGGKVDVYNYENGVWTLVQQLVPPQGSSQFGIGMAIEGNEAIIGANTTTVHGNMWQGAAYIYTETNGTWSQSAMLTANDGAADDLFGQTVSIFGNTVLIGAPDATVNGDQYAGKAYIFTESGGTWSQQAEFTASDAVASGFFGHALGLSSETVALVGSSAVPLDGVTGVGATYVFTDSNGTWSQTQELRPNQTNQGMGFGYAISVDGSIALIGAGLANGPNTTFQGAAYIFTNSGGTWSQTQKLTASDGQQTDQFGDSVAISGTTAVIGAWFANNAQGKAYVFTQSDGTWTQAQELLASDGQAGDLMGYEPFATSNGIALVSAYGHDNYAGAAYFFMPSDLDLALSAPQTVGQGQQYTSQTIATNSSSVASPAVSATITVPAAASFVAATASQGSCSEAAGVVTCDFGQIPGNAGMATANVTLKATGSAGTTIENTASVALATPALTASAPTGITSPAACPAGYTEFSGHLDAGETFTSDPITVSEAGQKYVDLTSPASFGFFTITTTSYGTHTYIYPHAKQGHRWGAAGSYRVGVQAGPDAGGDYTLCVNLNPAQ